MDIDTFDMIEGQLWIYQWERRDFRGTPSLLYHDKNVIPYCGRRHVALMATDPITYASRQISNMGLGFHSPFSDPLGNPMDLTRTRLVSDLSPLSVPIPDETAEGVYLSFSTVVIPSSPDSFITYEVNGWEPISSHTIYEEGLFPVVPWASSFYENEENRIIAYKQLSTPIPISPGMKLDIWHQIRFGSTI